MPSDRTWPLPTSPWVMRMTWSELLFAHWSLEPSAVARWLPRGLELDVRDGRAWVGVVPFLMSDVARVVCRRSEAQPVSRTESTDLCDGRWQAWGVVLFVGRGESLGGACGAGHVQLALHGCADGLEERGFGQHKLPQRAHASRRTARRIRCRLQRDDGELSRATWYARTLVNGSILFVQLQQSRPTVSWRNRS